MVEYPHTLEVWGTMLGKGSSPALESSLVFLQLQCLFSLWISGTVITPHVYRITGTTIDMAITVVVLNTTTESEGDTPVDIRESKLCLHYYKQP